MSDMDYEARLKATGRNDRCPCGSGKKYKKCHLAEDEGKRSAAFKSAEEEAKVAAVAKAEAEGEAEGEGDGKVAAKSTDKNKPRTKRDRGKSGSKGQAGDAKPKNMIRRSAV
jgi:hypothetical protein